MAYRSFSGEDRNQPQSQLSRTPSMNATSQHGSLPSPSATSPYAYQRQMANHSQSYPTQLSPQRAPMYPSSYYPAQYGTPQSAEMPRSLSYPSNFQQQQQQQPQQQQQYPSFLPSISAPALLAHGSSSSLPPMARHVSTSSMADGMAGMDLGRPQALNLGYSFQNRLPLVDRPFKCDECVQSFNRNHDLKRHKRIHLSVKPFGCDKCGKTFSRKDALRRHWLVKGCRGEDGATAPISEKYSVASLRLAC
ncbi:hypothetical protein P7C73_g4540, partial [Tremellales sp. Uapishka_1]